RPNKSIPDNATPQGLDPAASADRSPSLALQDACESPPRFPRCPPVASSHQVRGQPATAGTYVQSSARRRNRGQRLRMNRLDAREPLPLLRLEVIDEGPEQGPPRPLLRLRIAVVHEFELIGRDHRQGALPDGSRKPVEVGNLKVPPPRRSRFDRPRLVY